MCCRFHAVDCLFQPRISNIHIYCSHKVVISVSFWFYRVPQISAMCTSEIMCCRPMIFLFVWWVLWVFDSVVCYCSIQNLPLVRHAFVLTIAAELLFFNYFKVIYSWCIMIDLCSVRSSWCHCHPIISCSNKIQNGLPFWCRLTQVSIEKGC